MKSHFYVAVALFSLFVTLSVYAQGTPRKILILFGSPSRSNNSSYVEFSQEVINQATQGTINISLLPITLSSNPEQISPVEHEILLEKSEVLRTDLETACNQSASLAVNCDVSVIPIFVRQDVSDELLQEIFTQDMDAIFIPEGNSIVASQIIENTRLEIMLRDAYQSGVIIGGSGAGALLLSPVLIETTPDYSDHRLLEFGSVDLQNSLALIKYAVVEQNLMDSGNLSRLLNTISLPDIPHIGIGLEPDTGIKLIDDHRVESVLGNDSIIILDASTYHAADAVEYLHPRYFLSLHNVLVHFLPLDETQYDLESRQHALGGPPTYISRHFDTLSIPSSAGTLILGGDLSDSLKDNPILTHFVNLSGGENSNILVVASRYETQEEAQQDIEKYQANLRIPTQSLIITENSPQSPDLPVDISGIILLSGDKGQPELNNLQFIKKAWLSGIPLLTDGRATELIGAYYSTLDTSIAQISAHPDTQGLGLVDLSFVPSIQEDNRWHNVFELGYHHPGSLTIGINKDTALEISHNGASVLGENVIFLLDLRKAILEYNPLNEIRFANGLIDVFAPGERIHPEIADINLAPLHAVTPDLRTPTTTPTVTTTPLPPIPPTQTPLPTATRGRAPTRTPRPTITPPVVPPPGSSEEANLMIFLAIISVLVVLVGVWINRRHFN